MTAVADAARTLAAEWDTLGREKPALRMLLSADLARRAPGLLLALNALVETAAAPMTFTVYAWGPETARERIRERVAAVYGPHPWRVVSAVPDPFGEETSTGRPWVVSTAPA